MDDLRALPDEDFRFSLGIAPISAAEFFAPSTDDVGALAERQRLLAEDPTPYIAVTPAAAPLIRVFWDWSRNWSAPPLALAPPSEPAAAVKALGSTLPPDFVLLARNATGVCRVAAGCVCFPSTWRLHDKLNLTIAEVHDVVPGLNAVLSAQIDRLLAGLKPGKSWGRSNWGLSASPERNQHPDRDISAPDADAPPNALWLRREDQLLAALPDGQGLVFGIRIEHIPIATILQSPRWSQRLARGLATLTPGMIDYKRLNQVQHALLNRLRAAIERPGQ